jgi:hypothetical protein
LLESILGREVRLPTSTYHPIVVGEVLEVEHHVIHLQISMDDILLLESVEASDQLLDNNSGFFLG